MIHHIANLLEYINSTTNLYEAAKDAFYNLPCDCAEEEHDKNCPILQLEKAIKGMEKEYDNQRINEIS